jgi:hypothetical protein
LLIAVGSVQVDSLDRVTRFDREKKNEAVLARALAEGQSTSVLKRLLLAFVHLESLGRK